MSDSPRPPAQPLFPPTRSDPSSNMREFINALPDEAFRMSGPLVVGYRGVLYSKAPPATPEPEFWRYVSVTYQLLDSKAPSWGDWQGVIVAFHLPAAQQTQQKGRRSQEETLYVGISLKHWCDTNGESSTQVVRNVGGTGLGRSRAYFPQTVWRNLIVSWTQLGSGSAMFFSDAI